MPNKQYEALSSPVIDNQIRQICESLDALKAELSIPKIDEPLLSKKMEALKALMDEFNAAYHRKESLKSIAAAAIADTAINEAKSK